MTPKLYIKATSAHSLSVWMTCEAVGLEVDVVIVDLTHGEQKQSWFLEINPRHCVPTLVENGFVMCESRAIMRYLVNKYGQETSLYPAEFRHRFLVDMALDTDMDYIRKCIAKYVPPKLFHGKDPDEAAIKAVDSVLCFINDVMLKSSIFVAGDNMTIADLSIFATLQMLLLAGFQSEQFHNYEKLYFVMKYIKDLPYYSKCYSTFENAVIDLNS